MIFLLDDKKPRQSADYNWTAERLQEFSENLKPVYLYEEIADEKIRQDIFREGNVILFHDSFFDNTANKHVKNSVEIRKALNDFGEYKGYVVFFSGSKSGRSISENGRIAHLPVAILYENLNSFLSAFKEGKTDLNILLYGKFPTIEKELLNALNDRNNSFNEEIIQSEKKNLIFITDRRTEIPVEIKNSVSTEINSVRLSETKGVLDSFFNDLILQNLSETKFDNIFIPLCFGNTLSDFLGLRLATQIRCTPNINQTTSLFIYSFADFTQIIKNEYFNILKTKNVEIIDYSREAIKQSVDKEMETYTLNEIPGEITKLNLKVPANYTDNHSIANEWGLFQMAYNAGINIEEITDFDFEKLNSLYFKWLKTKNGMNEKISENEQSAQEQYRYKLKGIKQVGKISLDKFN